MTTTYTRQFPADISEYPQEIAETLIQLIEKHEEVDDKDTLTEELENGIYYIRTCAENSYNFDYFRILYSTLAKIAEIYKET